MPHDVLKYLRPLPNLARFEWQDEQQGISLDLWSSLEGLLENLSSSSITRLQLNHLEMFSVQQALRALSDLRLVWPC